MALFEKEFKQIFESKVIDDESLGNIVLFLRDENDFVYESFTRCCDKEIPRAPDLLLGFLSRIGELYTFNWGILVRLVNCFIAHKAFELARKFIDQMDCDYALNVVYALVLEGIVFEAEDNYEAAKRFMDEAILVALDKKNDIHPIDAHTAAIVALDCLARYALLENERPLAKEYYIRRLSISEKMYEAQKDLTSLYNLSRAYANLGEFATDDNELLQAERYFLKTIELFSHSFNQETDYAVAKDLMTSYCKIAAVIEKEGDIPRMLEYLDEAYQLATLIQQENPSMNALLDLYYCSNLLMGAFFMENDYDKTKEYANVCLDIAEQIAAETGELDDRRRIAKCYTMLGSVAEAEKDDQLALGYYQIAVRIFEEIVENLDTVENVRSLLFLYVVLRFSNISLGRDDEAKKIAKTLSDLYTAKQEIHGPGFAEFLVWEDDEEDESE